MKLGLLCWLQWSWSLAVCSGSRDASTGWVGSLGSFLGKALLPAGDSQRTGGPELHLCPGRVSRGLGEGERRAVIVWLPGYAGVSVEPKLSHEAAIQAGYAEGLGT